VVEEANTAGAARGEAQTRAREADPARRTSATARRARARPAEAAAGREVAENVAACEAMVTAGSRGRAS
jgi:hypothetical protein